MADLHYQTLADTCRQIKSGALTSVAVTEHLLARIAENDGKLGSFATVLAERAIEQATSLDAKHARGEPLGSLHGVPVAAKDLLFMEGLATASGTRVMADFIPNYTATTVAKLERAGAVIIGKTQLTEGAFGAHHPQIEPPKNPYEHAAWAGVSSSGSGVSVAAGLAYGALGSDTGGSIRFPSGCCGLVGIKPTYGRVSRYGAFPLAESLDHIGPMTRTVEDAARMLAVIAGEDANDASCSTKIVPNYSAASSDVEGLRIGVDWDYVEQGVDQVVVDGVKLAAAWLSAAGANIEEIKLPNNYRELVEGWGITCGVECARAHQAYYPEQASLYGPALKSLIELGRNVEMQRYQSLETTRQAFTEQFNQQIVGLAAVLIPTMPVMPQFSKVMEAGYDDSLHAPFINFTAPFDYSGHPTLTFPVGLSDSGLPLSVQLVGQSFAEEALVGLGYSMEQQRGAMPHPPWPHPSSTN
ncbi:MAG: amidase [Limisphaerales bacterium]|jgi:amidase